MATNPYIRNHDFTATQDLVEDLQIEIIKSMGMDVNYLPREIVKLDKIFGEDVLSQFNESYEIEMYMDHGDDWGGQGRFFSKFGLQDQRQLELVVSRKRFKEEVTANRSDIAKPRVGDIVFLKDTYETAPFSVVWVEEFSLQQRQLNRPYTWKLTCELLTYSHEQMNTSDTTMDAIEADFENLNSIINEPLADNTEIETEMETLKDSSATTSPFGNY